MPSYNLANLIVIYKWTEFPEFINEYIRFSNPVPGPELTLLIDIKCVSLTDFSSQNQCRILCQLQRGLLPNGVLVDSQSWIFPIDS